MCLLSWLWIVTQQSVVQDIFNAKAQGTDIGRYVSSSVSSALPADFQQPANKLTVTIQRCYDQGADSLYS